MEHQVQAAPARIESGWQRFPRGCYFRIQALLAQARVEVLVETGVAARRASTPSGWCVLVVRRAFALPPAFCFVHAAQYLFHDGLSTMDECIEQLRGCRREGEHVQVEIVAEGQLHVV